MNRRCGVTKLDEIVDIANLERHIAEGNINVQVGAGDGMRIFNYTARCQWARAWDNETRTCRGLIVRADDTVHARPFPKFFNLGEMASLPALPYRVFDKLDGSLGIVYEHPDGEPAVATRGSFTSDQALWATAWLRANPDYLRAARFAIVDGVTLLCEIIYPNNRIVIDYADKADLTLLAAIDIATGRDIHWDEWPGERAVEYPAVPLEALTNTGATNREGFVILWSDGTRAKAKFDEYVRLHRLVTGVSSKSIWEAMSTGHSLVEVLDRVPDEFYAWVRQVMADLATAYEAIEKQALDEMAGVPVADRRTQAEYIKGCAYPGVMFKHLDGKDYAPLIWKLIRPEHARPFRTDIDG